MGYYDRKYPGEKIKKRKRDPKGKYHKEVRGGRGKRCPTGYYAMQWGKSKGWCTSSKQKARRKPCHAMTEYGRYVSKRCNRKKDLRALNSM
jgi:hypothetical protein